MAAFDRFGGMKLTANALQARQALAQVLERSNLPISERSSLFSQFTGALSADPSSAVGILRSNKTINEAFSQQFARLQLSGREPDLGFFDASVFGKPGEAALPSSIAWQTQTSGFGGSRVKAIQEVFGGSTVSHGMRATGTFNVAGLGQQTSHVDFFDVRLKSGVDIQLPYYTPSGAGIVAQASRGRAGMAMSQSLYVLPQTFVFDPDIKSMKAQRGGFAAYQQNLLKQLHGRIGSIESNQSINSAGRVAAIQEAVGTYKREIERFQYLLGGGGELASTTHQGLMGGRLSKASLQSQMAVFAPGFSDFPMHTTKHFELMRATVPDIAFQTQPTPASRGFGIQGGGYQIGPHVPTFKEPLKSYGELAPLVSPGATLHDSLVPRRVRTFSSFTDTPFANAFHRPTGIQAVTTYMNPMAQHLGERSNLLMPEGQALASREMFRSGALDVGHLKQYKVKLSGPGGRGEGLFGTEVRDILGRLSAGETAEEIFGQEGITLRRGAALGIAPGTGEEVRSMNRKYINERIIGLDVGDTPDQVRLTVARQVTGKETGAFPMKAVGLGGFKYELSPAEPTQIAAAMTRYGGMQKEAAATFASNVDIAQMSSVLDDPVNRAQALAGGVRYGIGTKMGLIAETGEARAALQGIAKQGVSPVAMNIMGMTNEQFLHHMHRGGAQFLEAIQQVSPTTIDPKTASVISAAEGKMSLLARTAAVAKAIAGGDDNLIHQILAPYTSWGRGQGIDVGKELFGWTEEQLAGAQRVRSNKERALNIAEEVSKGLGTDVAGAQGFLSRGNVPLKGLTTFSPRDYGALVGEGMKGTLEPRFLDIAMLGGDKAAVARDLTRNMTNYMPVMNKLAMTMRGDVPSNLPVMSIRSSSDYESMLKQMGKQDLVVDLGLGAKGDALGFKGGKIFVPGGEDIRGMGMAHLGTGLEREKTLRSVYTSFFEKMRFLGGQGFKSTEELQQVTDAFRGQLSGAFSEQIFGVPGGSTHGLMRGAVHGSASSRFVGMGTDTMELLGLLGDTGRQFDKRATTFRDKFLQTIKGGESLGRQTILSKLEFETMYKGAMQHAQQTGGDTALIKQWATTLKSGGSVLAAAWRHPGIGPGSLSHTRVWLDTWSQETGREHYVRGGQSFINTLVNQIDNAGNKIETELSGLFQTALAQDMNADFDGDRINLAFMSSVEGNKALVSMMKNEHAHARKYGALKAMGKASVDIVAEANAQVLEHNFPGSSMQMSKWTKELLAAGSPKMLTPRMSNIFTEMKFRVGASSLGEGAKQDIFRFFEMAEQVPISGKKVANIGELAGVVLDRAAAMRNAMDQGSQAMSKSVANFFELFTAYRGDDNAVKHYQTLEIEAGHASQGRQQLDLVKMQRNIVNAIEESHSVQGVSDVINVIRKKGAAQKIDPIEMLRSWESASSIIAPVHGHVVAGQTFTQGSGAQQAKSMMSNIVEATVEKGQYAKMKLPTQGVLGIAAMAGASMLAAGAVNIAMSPTWRDGQSGGAHIDPEDMFGDEISPQNYQLHGGAMPSPEMQHMIHSGQQTTVRMSPGSHNPRTLGGMVAAAAAGSGGPVDARVQLMDDRKSLDAISIAKLKGEII